MYLFPASRPIKSQPRDAERTGTATERTIDSGGRFKVEIKSHKWLEEKK
jgi:hypothetical protein